MGVTLIIFAKISLCDLILLLEKNWSRSKKAPTTISSSGLNFLRMLHFILKDTSVQPSYHPKT